MINRLNPFSKSILTFALVSACSVLLIWLLNPVIVPIIVALVLYVCLSPFHDWLTYRGWKRGQSALFILVFLMFVMFVPGTYLLSILSEQMSLWQSKASVAGNSLNLLLEQLSQQLANWQINIKVSQLKEGIVNSMSGENHSVLGSVSQFVVSFSTLLILVPFITFFLLRDFESLRNRLLQALPNQYFEVSWLIYFKVANQTEGYVRAVLIQQSILASVATIGFWMAGFPSPLILGVIAGVLGLIPYLGPALGLIPPFYLVLATQPLEFNQMLYAVLVIGVAYLVDNLFVIPFIVAKYANLHPLIALLGIIVFGNFFGILGMIAAIPLISISNIVISQLLLSFNPKKFKSAIA